MHSRRSYMSQSGRMPGLHLLAIPTSSLLTSPRPSININYPFRFPSLTTCFLRLPSQVEQRKLMGRSHETYFCLRCKFFRPDWVVPYVKACKLDLSRNTLKQPIQRCNLAWGPQELRIKGFPIFIDLHMVVHIISLVM